MHSRDLDKNTDSSRDSSDVDTSRSRMGGGKSDRSSTGSSSERMRDSEDIGSDMSESAEDLQRKQREGNLGNERIRGGGERE